MKKQLITIALGFAAGGFLVNATATADVSYEKPPVFDAARILPAKLLKSSYHSVGSKVSNDGQMNRYTIKSKFGTVTADSTAELKIRVDEMRALAAMERVSNSGQFTRQVKEGGKNVVAGAKALVNRPVDTVKGAFAAIGALAGRVGDALMGDPLSDAEGSRVENVIGFSSTKRDYAAEFHADPFSTNPLLQNRLEEIALYGYSGKIATSAVSAVIPGGVGVFVSAAKTSDWLEGIPVQTPPSELRKTNREKLVGMGVSPDVIDLFEGNTVYSPVQQTKFVQELARMNGTTDRGNFVKFAVLARNSNAAFFRARQAEMYANLNKVTPVERFVRVGTNGAARLANGTVVFCFPLDYLAWTENNAKLAESLDRQVSALPDIHGKEIHIAGGISSKARKALEDLGWKVLVNQKGLST
jgi:hypothetical protein